MTGPAVAPQPNYAHRARPLEIHDGDSFWLAVDFGRLSSGVLLEIPLYIRLYGMDAWELSQPLGPAARDFTAGKLHAAAKVTLQTIKPDGAAVGLEKYGRVLARVWVDDDELATLLDAAGYRKQSS